MLCFLEQLHFKGTITPDQTNLNPVYQWQYLPHNQIHPIRLSVASQVSSFNTKNADKLLAK